VAQIAQEVCSVNRRQQARFRRLVRALQSLLVEVQASHPEASYYVNSDALHLLATSRVKANDTNVSLACEPLEIGAGDLGLV